jgi:hypothetical protein
VRDLVLAYYFVLRRVLRARPELRRCRTRCRHCRVFFLTHPRNAGRKDLGCPFGCREAHRKQASSERSTAYNRTPTGRLKKKALNGKRTTRSGSPAVATEPSTGSSPDAGAQTPEAVLVDVSPSLLDHVCMVVRLVEGFRVAQEAVLEMLARTLRQRRIWRERKIDYVVRRLAGHPP